MDELDPVVLAGFQSLPFPTGVLDTDGAVYFANWKWSEFREEHGTVGPAERGSDTYVDACRRSDNADGSLVAHGLRTVLAGDRPDFSVEYSIQPESTRRWFLLRAVGYEHEGDRYALVVHVEITDRKRAELDAREQSDHLELVLRTIRHDIQSPLSAALGWTELLEEEYDDERLDRVEESLRRVERILNGPLAAAQRDELGETEPVDLATAARDAWSHIDTAEATLQVESTTEFEADPDLVAHVFENLFRNAVEHAGADAEIHVGTRTEGFYVADDGPGIPEDERERIFESGYTTNEQGRGFGLAIVDRIASLHGWGVRATASELGGACFEFVGVESVGNGQE